MSLRGRDTSEIAIDKKAKEEILRNCSNPELLKAIFEMADGLAFGRSTIDEFEAFCKAQPCILWTPSDETQRHITVRIYRESDRALRQVCRVVWRICLNVVSAQGPALRGDEEVLHFCGHNGKDHNNYGTCLNPACFVRGNEENRQNLAYARLLMKKSLTTNRATA